MKVINIIIAVSLAAAITACTGKQSDQGVKPTLVKTMIVSDDATAGTRSYVGTVEESTGSMLSFSGMGTVSQVLADEGQAVRQGQVLAVLDKTTANNSYEIAKSTLKQTQDAFNRLNTLYKKGSLPEIKYIEIQTQLAQAQAGERIARKSLDDCVLHAPFSGYISQRNVDIGNNVAPGVSCFKLVKIDNVKVKVAVPEKEIAGIHQGQNIGFTVDALEGRQFVGRVSEKGVQANPLSHTYDVKLSLANPRHELMPGMVCSVNINTSGAKGAIVVPQGAVMVEESGKFVWLSDGSKAIKRNVTVGGVNDVGVIITGGLNIGDKIIVEGQNKVSDGTKIKEQ